MITPHHKTNDPYLASFLVNQGAILVGSTRLGPKKVEFRFIADQRLHALLRLYWSEVPVFLIPSSLFAELTRLKSRSLTRRPKPMIRLSPFRLLPCRSPL